MRSFLPPQRILMGPGPSDVPSRVLLAMARPTIGHLDPAFILFMDALKDLLRKTFLTKNKLTFPVSGPGSAGMELCFANLVEPGDQVLVCVNGVFGQRMVENVKRLGGVPIIVEDKWGRAVDPQKVKEVLSRNSSIRLMAMVHAETSTGVNSDIKTLAEIAKAFNVLTIVDTVTSLGGIEVRVDDWQLDAVYSGTQKCLSAPPGLSPVTFSEEALAKVKRRKNPVTSWFFDLNLIMNYWDGDQGRAYHHTAPINNLYGLHETLLILHEEGLENAWERHYTQHQQLKSGLEPLGLEFIVPVEERLPQLNAVLIPSHVNDLEVRKTLLEKYSLEIGAGLGPLQGKIWRIGLMGQSCNMQHVLYCISALKESVG